MATGSQIALFKARTWRGTAGLYNGWNMNDSGDAIAGVYQAHKTGTIDRIGLFIVSETGTGPTYDARLETITGGTNAPSGTLIATDANGTFDSNALGTGWHYISLTTPYAITAGDLFAVVIRYSSGTINGSNFVAMKTGYDTSDQGSPFMTVNSGGGGWSDAQDPPTNCPVYDDDTIHPGAVPLNSVTQNTWDSADAIDERAIKWTQPWTGTCIGAEIEAIGPNSSINSDFDVVLYDSDSSALATYSHNVESDSNIFARDLVTAYWAGVELTAESVYRLSIKPTHASATVIWWHLVCEDAITLAACGFEGANRSTRADAGAWTDDTFEFFPITPIFSSVDAASDIVVIQQDTNIVLPRPGVVGY